MSLADFFNFYTTPTLLSDERAPLAAADTRKIGDEQAVSEEHTSNEEVPHEDAGISRPTQRRRLLEAGASSTTQEPHKQSLILTFSQEILTMIFMHYVFALQPYDRGRWFRGICNGSYTSDNPITLSSVCTEWRRIALSTPAIWGPLHIISPLTPDMDLLDLWVKRSSPLPLDVSLDMVACFHGPRVRPIVQETFFKKLLIEHGARVRSLHLALPDYMEAMFKSVASDPAAALPNLVSFRLTLPQWSKPGKAFISKFLAGSPKVQSAGWHTWRCVELVAGYPHTPWGTLTAITLGSILHEDLRSVLRHTPKLEVLNIQCIMAPDLGERYRQQILTLQHLRVLSLRVSPPIEDGDVEFFFDGIALPALTHFRAEGAVLDYPELRALEKMVVRSHCRIECVALNFEEYDRDQEHVGYALQFFDFIAPSMRRLVIEGFIHDRGMYLWHVGMDNMRRREFYRCLETLELWYYAAHWQYIDKVALPLCDRSLKTIKAWYVDDDRRLKAQYPNRPLMYIEEEFPGVLQWM